MSEAPLFEALSAYSVVHDWKESGGNTIINTVRVKNV